VGGGFDVLNAIDHDASRITGVEINARHRLRAEEPVQRLLPGLGGRSALHPRQRRGPALLATHADTWDVIQLSGVDSYSGTLAAAHVFSESYLYTAEAFDLYLSRLGPQGILNLMRLRAPAPARDAARADHRDRCLRRAGVAEPAQHIVTITATPAPNFTALLVKKTPFKPEEVARLRRGPTAARTLMSPPHPTPAVRPRTSTSCSSRLRDPRRERAFVARYPVGHLAGARRPALLLPPVVLVAPVHERSPDHADVRACDGDHGPHPAGHHRAGRLITVYLPLRLLTGRGRALPSSLRYGGFFAGVGLG
jgi:hypothetical protein